MMQQKTRMHPGVALKAALELMAMLGDVVGRIEIGGSLRRCAEMVGALMFTRRTSQFATPQGSKSGALG